VFTEREILGFALAPMPFVGPPVLVGSAALLWQFHSAILWLILAVIVAGYTTTLMVGIPVHLFLRRTNRRRLSHYLMATLAVTINVVIAAAVVAAFYNAHELAQHKIIPGSAESGMTEVENPFGPPPSWSRAIWGVVVFGMTLAIPACISAALFWQIAVRQTLSSHHITEQRAG
jgi:hypothetical protein